MKKKIICISFVILLIGSTLPALGTVSKYKILKEISYEKNDYINQITEGRLNLEDWLEHDKLTASDGTNYDFFGGSVSIDRYYAIIGAYGKDALKGAAYVFMRGYNSWDEMDKLTASDGASLDFFGCSVSIDGAYALVGAFGNEGNKGAAYVFKRDGIYWYEEDKLIASDSLTDDFLGISVCINGYYALVGASGKDGNQGAAYVFKRDGYSWVEEDKLTASDGSTGDLFGGSVCIDGDYALIGASGKDGNKGAAYVFKRDGNSWIEEDKITASDGSTDDKFGWSVSINGSYSLVGAVADDDNGVDSGSAYVFKRDGSSWLEEEKLIASDGADIDKFGYSVSISGNYSLVGAVDDDDNGVDSGSAYIFIRNETSWIEEDKISASDGSNDNYFGYSVSIDYTSALIGAHNNEFKGSAYVFIRGLHYPDIECEGTNTWVDVSPGEIVYGTFMVINRGSFDLNWEISEWPEWGEWDFGENLYTLPPWGSWIVYFNVTAPDKTNSEFTGEIKMINVHNESDYCTIDVSLATPVSHTVTFLELLAQRFPIIAKILEILLG